MQRPNCRVQAADSEFEAAVWGHSATDGAPYPVTYVTNLLPVLVLEAPVALGAGGVQARAGSGMVCR